MCLVRLQVGDRNVSVTVTRNDAGASITVLDLDSQETGMASLSAAEAATLPDGRALHSTAEAPMPSRCSLTILPCLPRAHLPVSDGDVEAWRSLQARLAVDGGADALAVSLSPP